MRRFGQRLLIGLAALAAVVMAVGYAFIAGRIASPLGGDLGTFTRGVDFAERDVAAVHLADGRPAFIVAEASGTAVLDARAPALPGAPGRLVKWCIQPGGGYFVDLVGEAAFDSTGERIDGTAPEGLLHYPISDDGSTITVHQPGTTGRVAERERAIVGCPSGEFVGHGAAEELVFDPSVAVDQEPPGWIWLEGSLAASDGEVALCDGLQDGCATGALVRGIDPAMVPEGDARLTGLFIGRVRDDAIERLAFVPEPGDTR